MVYIHVGRNKFKRMYYRVYGQRPPVGLTFSYLYKQYCKASNFGQFMDRHALWFWQED